MSDNNQIKIGIELITKGENALKEVLDSIEKQTFKDFLVTCVNSSGDHNISKLLKERGVKEVQVPIGTKHLMARYLAHKESEGTYRLMLDSTRPLEYNALETLINKYSQYKAVCLREGTLGSGFWVKQAESLKKVSELNYREAIKEKSAYILPRFYKSEILDYAFDYLMNEIDTELFNEIGYGEHHLIFEACNLKPEEIGFTDEILIKHYEDKSLKEIIKKYKWYGHSQKTLNKLPVSFKAKKLVSHKRQYKLKDLGLFFKTIPIRTIRTISFIIGYIF